MLLDGLRARFENEPHTRACERRRAEVTARPGNREIQTFARRQDAVARVEPERAGLIRLYCKTEVEQITLRPQRVFHLYVEREVRTMRRLHAERRQIDCDTVESAAFVLPAGGRN